jgi:hypothetical protein
LLDLERAPWFGPVFFAFRDVSGRSGLAHSSPSLALWNGPPD